MDRNEAVRNRLPHHEPSKSLDD